MSNIKRIPGLTGRPDMSAYTEGHLGAHWDAPEGGPTYAEIFGEPAIGNATKEALDELAQSFVDAGIGNSVTVLTNATANPVCPLCDEGSGRCKCDND